jgi:hypothetical protein
MSLNSGDLVGEEAGRGGFLRGRGLGLRRGGRDEEKQEEENATEPGGAGHRFTSLGQAWKAGRKQVKIINPAHDGALAPEDCRFQIEIAG